MNAQDFPYITRILQSSLENGSTPGVALLVRKNGDCLYRKALGYAQIYPENRELTEDTIFDIASLTKVVATTTAVMLLLRDKKLKLQDPVKKYVPEFPYQQITLTHLLTHSAGFPDWLPLYEDIQQEAKQHSDDFVGFSEAKRLLIEKVCHTEFLYPPGQYSKYSDLGFILLGHIIENISGTTLDRYCHDMIFQPLEMSSTFFRKMEESLRKGNYAATERCEWRRRVLVGEVHDENACAMGGVAGHAGLFSTVDDIQRFMIMLSRCYHGDDDMLPKSIVQKFFARQNVVESSTRALGWDTPSRNKRERASGGTLISEKSVGHTGFTGTSIWFDLKRKLLIVLFSNRIHPSRHNQTFLNIRPKIHDTIIIAMDRHT